MHPVAQVLAALNLRPIFAAQHPLETDRPTEAAFVTDVAPELGPPLDAPLPAHGDVAQRGALLGPFRDLRAGVADVGVEAVDERLLLGREHPPRKHVLVLIAPLSQPALGVDRRLAISDQVRAALRLLGGSSHDRLQPVGSMARFGELAGEGLLGVGLALLVAEGFPEVGERSVCSR